ncbi:PHD-finger family protein [Trichomonas vaginalis G3]|uniref:PHD-finger family protein n=1 Tax=Trichomonas vaginalis (strain ATCC PRA-98 / G3) TaxID=412133 RepID=A2FG01_TRIV3|nr:UPSET, isoform A family [Trichomonas vaginalis G3]EAX96163.1 PHD-finger family protein [Trichomonas vaginalis G3]KAI5495099.1 UPSET, isoform A family [Trichomonas vaginalis G3]|eukprot:XP_001309093.1 PHD-finger family protein [Trichomonas vaginalis G3]
MSNLSNSQDSAAVKKNSIQSLMSSPEHPASQNSGAPSAPIIRKVSNPTKTVVPHPVVRINPAIVRQIKPSPEISKPPLPMPAIPRIDLVPPSIPAVPIKPVPYVIPKTSSIPDMSNIPIPQPSPQPRIMPTPIPYISQQHQPLPPQPIPIPSTYYPYQTPQPYPQPYLPPTQPQYYQQLRAPIPHPVISIPKVNQHSIQPPEPVFFNDKRSGRYGIRCVCGESRNDGLLIQCDSCEFWLHAKCVNIARISDNESFYCPFCRGQRIKCKCKNNKNYTDPIVQCTNCKFWVHKRCENLYYGFCPHDFVCSNCQPDKTYTIPFNKLNPEDLKLQSDIIVSDINRQEIVSNIVEGRFHDEIQQDLSNSEISFCNLISKYFTEYASLLFDRIRGFWACFVDTFSSIFNVDKKLVMRAIDVLANKLIYNTSSKTSYQPVKFFEMSDEIQLSSSTSLIRIEKPQHQTELIITDDDSVISNELIEDGAFIMELSGFLMHMDEVRCENGIPISCITVTTDDTSVLDVSNSAFPQAALIRRSFHFNCVVKLVRIGGNVRAALYGVKPTGPLSEEKGRRGPSIQPGQELVLPLDGYIPFDTQKIEWKDKKARPKTNSDSFKAPNPRSPNSNSDKASYTGSSSNSSAKSTIQSRRHHSESSSRSSSPPPPKEKKKKQNKSQERRKSANGEEEVQLSLLSGFLYDIIPPIPFILLPDQEAVEQYNEKKSSSSKKKSLKYSDY